ncbi:hypothetical protein VN97_g8565 [Penicillium thymicola]|uniref:Uncharacterized protein n=1 Tax=Penicillium thymicola TaxID=293382 RepID=A0AAI9TDJ7_PENTH|nr:hypothetical protein VN97_g8565 [Penicillium thymicola]
MVPRVSLDLSSSLMDLLCVLFSFPIKDRVRLSLIVGSTIRPLNTLSILLTGPDCKSPLSESRYIPTCQPNATPGLSGIVIIFIRQ